MRTFEDQGLKFQVPICKSCDGNLGALSTNQSQTNILKIVCHHSKVAANIIRNFDNPEALSGWLELSEDVEDEDNVEVIHVKQDKSTKSHHLALAIPFY